MDNHKVGYKALAAASIILFICTLLLSHLGWAQAQEPTPTPCPCNCGCPPNYCEIGGCGRICDCSGGGGGGQPTPPRRRNSPA